MFSFTAGHFPKNSSVSFRGDSGLQDGNSSSQNLVGGFYDSGNNIKFSFPTAYTITLLSWTVIEYHQKYADIGELEHVKDIIKWGSDYLLKLFIPPPSNSTSSSTTILFSQASYLRISYDKITFSIPNMRTNRKGSLFFSFCFVGWKY